MNLLFLLCLLLWCLLVLLVRFHQRLHGKPFLDLPQQLSIPCDVRLPGTLVLGFTPLLWLISINVGLLVHGFAAIPVRWFVVSLAFVRCVGLES